MVKEKNKSIFNIARNILKIENMLNKFWVEVINYVIYLLNKFSMKSLNDMTLL